ncbi:MAG TPA: imidazole glycerol phosphate synthase subunit HisH [Planctomycetota bacterium]|nr:imidazole glycerol phosphate synthase subunit HisH [Planctomycetota bacterium]
MHIAICDYGIGNLRSAEKAFQHLGFDAALTTNPADLKSADRIVLPGVGNFGECMTNLEKHGFVGPLREEVARGKPLLGICVGLQMMFERSEECPGVQGLGLLKGAVEKFRGPQFDHEHNPQALKVPQIGWNALSFPAPHPLFKGLGPESHVYFVHSFYAKPVNESDVLAWSDYGFKFCASAGRKNIMGVQFHPEKSQTVGLSILKNFGTLTL